MSPSLMNSPVTSTAPSPSHHASHVTSGGPSSILDDSFPKSLMERLLRTESHVKVSVVCLTDAPTTMTVPFQLQTRHTMASVPSSPKAQRSTSSTPGVNGQMTMSMGGLPVSINSNGEAAGTSAGGDSTGSSNRNSIMSRSMEGPRSLPPQSPARPHSNNSTLDRRYVNQCSALLASINCNIPLLHKARNVMNNFTIISPVQKSFCQSVYAVLKRQHKWRTKRSNARRNDGRLQ